MVLYSISTVDDNLMILKKICLDMGEETRLEAIMASSLVSLNILVSPASISGTLL
jgi:hypothetical protein